MITVFYIIVLVFSVILHEIAHGFVALRLGDTTAKDAGRLTLNPLPHLDIFGSILLPLFLVLSNLPVIGWAKPVPYDPRFLKKPKQYAGLIALAGPATNFLIAIIFGLLARILFAFGITSEPLLELFYFFNIIVLTNIGLGCFNLIPIPPLDGSGILFSILPHRFNRVEDFLRRYGFFILIIFIATGVQFLSPVIFSIHALFVGTGAAQLLM